MNQTKVLRSIVITCLVLVVTSCAGNKPIGEWRNEEFSGKLDNILIIGVTSRSTRRRVFEDGFVKQLAASGTQAVPSYTLLESSLELTREIVVRAIEGKDLGGVLVTRLVGIKEKETYRLPANYDDDREYMGYYNHAWKETSGGYYAQHKVFTLQTNLYDTASGELVWSMQSEAMDVSQPRQVIEEQIDLTIRTLSKQGLI